MWKWICGGGRGVWLWSESSELPFSGNREVCLSPVNPASWRSSFVCLQECYKECCKKCSLANSAQCTTGPCCNTTCLVCVLASLHYNPLTPIPNIECFIAVLASFFHVVTAAATPWTTVISQRPAPATLDRCSHVTLLSMAWFHFLHVVHIQLKCYTCACFTVSSEPSQTRWLPLSG